MKLFLKKIARVIVRGAIYIYCKIVHRAEIVGKENIRKNENFIFCGNHRNYLDPPLIVSTVGRHVRFMAKEDLRKIAEVKLPDLNAYDVEAAMNIREGTARNMGIAVKGVNDAELAEQAAEARKEEAEAAKRDAELAEMEAEAKEFNADVPVIGDETKEETEEN